MKNAFTRDCDRYLIAECSGTTLSPNTARKYIPSREPDGAITHYLVPIHAAGAVRGYVTINAETGICTDIEFYGNSFYDVTGCYNNDIKAIKNLHIGSDMNDVLTEIPKNT